MGFDKAMRAAAKAADKAVMSAMAKYAATEVTDEDDLTGILIGRLDAAFDDHIGGIRWSSSVVRHRKGAAAEEQRIGADIVIHVALKTQIQTYSKGVLVQAKRHEPGDQMSAAQRNALVDQCNTMLHLTPAAFVFDYAKTDMRCASASKIVGSMNRDLYEACNWTSYRFFLELFRSPIGDPKLTSALVRDLPVPNILLIKGSGDVADE